MSHRVQARVPVLDVINKSGLTDVCVVVTRYFGGILLGASGLTRAYSQGCSMAVNAARKMKMCECSRISFSCDYTLYGKVSYALPEYGVIMEKEDFADSVNLAFLVKSEFSDKLKNSLRIYPAASLNCQKKQISSLILHEICAIIQNIQPLCKNKGFLNYYSIYYIELVCFIYCKGEFLCLPREQTELFEKQFLSENACLSVDSKGRKEPCEPCPLRTCFQRDRDRILHCNSFRRLKHKTQVYLSPGDHYRTRLTHTLEVSQIARTISRALRLNEDLTEAIALGHDLGHTPFGHAGERALNELSPDGFHHYEQSLRVVDILEKTVRVLTSQKKSVTEY